MTSDKARKIAADLLDGPLLNSPSIPCMLAMPMVKVSKKRSGKPITARRNDNSVEYAFGCSRVFPSNKE